jgi:hypothetical protein
MCVCWSSGVLLCQEKESLIRWPYYREVVLPPASAGLLDFALDADILHHSRQDHGDVRLYDANRREIPYALRVRRDVHTTDTFQVREFNRSRRGGVTEIYYDLGDTTSEHNEIEIDTAGQNFRRQVAVDGSQDALQWATLVSDGWIFRFQGSYGSADERRVTYPVSRYRYLRLRVSADPQVDGAVPTVNSVAAHRTFHLEGETQEFPVMLQGREPARLDGRPASAYDLDLGGPIPLEGLTLVVAEASFSRPYRIEALSSGEQHPRVIASGRLVRPESGPAEINFHEQFARRLRLTIADDRNPPLTLASIRARSAARQIVFEGGSSSVLRLYYGNPDAAPPHYDFADSLPTPLLETPTRLFLGPQHANPDYEPEPQPISERSPWLIYVVLGAASLALLAILRNLVREMGPV